MTRSRLAKLFAPPPVAGRLGIALLLLRLIVGVAFWFHGSGKLVDLTAFATEFDIPYALAAGAAYTQAIGAVLVILGLLTPLASLGLAASMSVAMIELIARGERFVDPGGHSWEAPAFYLVANVVLALTGPGRWALDAVFWSGSGRRAEQFA